MRSILLLFCLVCSLQATTKLRLHDSPSAVSSCKAMDLSLGPPSLAQVTAVTTTVNSGTDIQMTKTAGGTALCWASEPLASGFTMSGTLTFNVYGGENATATNAAFRGRVYQYTGGSKGTAKGLCEMTTELNTTLTTARNFTCTPTSTVFATGDRVYVELYVENCATSGCPTGTMAAGTTTVNYDGATDATNGSSWVQLNETVTFTPDGGSGGTPSIIQMVSTPNVSNGSQLLAAGASATVQLPRLTKANNYIAIAFQYQNGTGWSVTDDQSNPYTLGPTCTDAAQATQIAYYYTQNAAANVHTITVTHSTGTASWFAASAFEATNVATSGSLDASSANCPAAAMTTSLTAGSMTPLTSGDLLVQFFSNSTHGNSGTSITAGSQANITWSLYVSNIFDGMGVQSGTYTSTSAINPTMAQQASPNDTMSLAVALKSSIAGTAGAAGIQLAAIHTTVTIGADSGLFSIQVPIRGNTLALMFSAGANDQLSSITSSPDISAKCTLGAYHASPNAHNGAQHFYCQDVTPGNYTFTLTYNNNPTASDSTVMWHDIIGGATVAFDLEAFTNGVKSGTTDVTGVSITPTTPNGLILADIPVDFDTVISTTTSGALLQNGYLSSNTVGNTLYYNNNGNSSYLNPNTSAVTFVWHFQTGLGANIGDWTSGAIAFKAPAAGGGACSMSLLGVGTC